ncbi:ribonuclease III [Thermosipho melanesiensis]|nr:ribonuclease III [Thermosipho melanesiensis]OOC37345.1 ribonuclease III [Thermosipho melanesiensis]OOC38097.1 ribonuclease III [Thermosipho melanesiensis]OOC41326.1 ribonuclease III [Thermosipho melanesiensis]OOC43321.1 ribonuclease III [Thermosipho melanesiensis]
MEHVIGYRFRNKELLFTALTHTSYANENKKQSYERLEFLGDSVIDILVCTILYEQYQTLNEGTMAQIKSAVTSEDILFEIAKKFNLGKYILLGKGERRSRGSEKKSILADVVESLIAAIYLDSNKNLKLIENLFSKIFKDYIDIFLTGKRIFDYKTKLQELTQDKFKQLPVYETTTVGGKFITTLKINNKIYSKAKGSSKKDAEKLAAKIAYEKLKEEEKYGK